MIADPPVDDPAPLAGKPRVLSLGPSSTGRWLVNAESRHIFDFDRGTYQRLVGTGCLDFPLDGKAVHLYRVERWPQLGGTFLILLHVDEWRRSSQITSITRIVDPA